MWRNLRRAAGILGWAATVLCVAALMALGLGPHTGRYRTATVLSASMRPTIPEGSVVVVTPLPAEQLHVGDVVMYRIPEGDRRVVSHRVVEILEPGTRPVVRTQGDANPAPDAWTARLEGGSLWQVRAAVPGLGHLVQALRDPHVRPILVGVVPALLAALCLHDIWRAPGADEDDREAADHPTPAQAGA